MLDLYMRALRGRAWGDAFLWVGMFFLALTFVAFVLVLDASGGEDFENIIDHFAIHALITLPFLLVTTVLIGMGIAIRALTVIAERIAIPEDDDIK